MLLIMWTIIDLLPSTYLFWIHYRNFMSFEGHDYLSTQFNDLDDDFSQSDV